MPSPPAQSHPSELGSGLSGFSPGGVASGDTDQHHRASDTEEQQTTVPARRRRVDSNIDLAVLESGQPLPFASAQPSPKRIRSDEYGSQERTPLATGSPFEAVNNLAAAPTATPRRAIITMSSSASKGLKPLGRALLRQGDGTTRTGTLRLDIKNRRDPAGNGRGRSNDDARYEEYFDSTWKEMEGAVDDVLEGRRLSISLNRLYMHVQELCRNNEAQKVYDRLVSKVEARLMGPEAARLWAGGCGDDVQTLSCLRDVWKVWNEKSKTIRATFRHLDRTFLLKHKKLLQINDMLIVSFRKMLFHQGDKSDDAASSSMSAGEMAISGMCKIMQCDRENREGWDAELLRDAIMILHVLSAYTKRLEPTLIAKSTDYFVEFTNRRSLLPLRDYITQCRVLLDREIHRCSAFNFDPSTKRSLITQFQKISVENYEAKLLEDESLVKLLDDVDVPTLHSLYYLLSLSKMEKKLLDPWGRYIRTKGASVIRDLDRGDEMVPRLLILRRALDTMVRDSLAKNDDFVRALRDGFAAFMNDQASFAGWESGSSKMGEMIARYVDQLLRGGIKAVPAALQSTARDRDEAAQERGVGGGVGPAGTDEDAELDRQLDQALELFRFIEGKAAFEAFYKRGFARRLLLDRSASTDAERGMLAKLRGECGASFTHNLEQMFKDKEVARDEMETYRQFVAASANDAEKEDDNNNNNVDDDEDDEDKTKAKKTKKIKVPYEMHVMILSAAAWPTFPDAPVNMPASLKKEIERFDAFYRNKHTGRILTWRHSLAHCVVKASFPKGPKELAVSAFQAVILLLFNDVPASSEGGGGGGMLSYGYISEKTGLTGSELARALQSLACGKARVLTKTPRGKEVRPTDRFQVNEAFSDPKFKVKINQIQARESKEETKATHEKIVKDRKLETQAAIVRIMKSRRTLTHAVLVAEVIQMTRKRGSIDAGEIKMEIESLIEKDYLERDGGSYVYLA